MKRRGPNDLEAEIIIASPPHRDQLVTEIWLEGPEYDSHLFAELFWKQNAILVEFAHYPKLGPWALDLNWVEALLHDAKTVMLESRK